MSDKIVNVPQFNSIDFDGIGTVHIIQGTPQKVLIRTDDNFKDNITTNYDGGVFIIQVTGNIAPTQLDIYITFEDISQLYLKGSGRIVCDSTINQNNDIWLINSGNGNIELHKLIAKNINTDLTGSGNIIINDGTSNFIRTNNNGYGSINLIGLQSKRANATNSSFGATSIYVSDYLNVEIYGKGNVWYKGNPQIDSTITGTGKLIKL